MTDLYAQHLGHQSKQQEKGRSYNIWAEHPSAQDRNHTVAFLKGIFLIIIAVSFALLTYSVTNQIYMAVGFALFLILVFCMVFYDSFFYLRGILRRSHIINPFKEILFWQIPEEDDILYYTHMKDIFTVGMKIIQVTTLPENLIHPNLDRFFKSLSGPESSALFSYQILHKKMETGEFKTNIYFTIFSSFKGKASIHKVQALRERMLQYETRVYAQFPANLHHTHVQRLKGKELLHALRSRFLQKELNLPEKEDEPVLRNEKKLHQWIKIVLVVILIVVFNYYFLWLKFNFTLSFGINILLLGAITLLWWRELLRIISRHQLFAHPGIQVVNPFAGIMFYYYPCHPDMYFAYVYHQELIGIKIFNVKYILPQFYCSWSKFLQAINSYQVPFTYTSVCHIRSYEQFYRECCKCLRIDEQERIGLYNNTTLKELEWLERRGGIWKIMLLFSTSYSVSTKNPSVDELDVITREVSKAAIQLHEITVMYFQDFIIEPLKRQLLLSGMQCELLKNSFVRLFGSYLHFVWVQGINLVRINYIAPELRRSIATRIAAEFNTPLYLENDIIIGNTFYTETLEEEIPVGFRFEQLQSLLITNGNYRERELIAMKIIAELIKQCKPSVIFDFYGMWAKLLTYFDTTEHKDNLLYFKLKKAFTLDPLKSEILYENDNIGFLEYMFDSFALCFQKDERTMDAFKNTIRNDPSLDISETIIKMKNTQNWKRDKTYNALIAQLHNFSKEDLMFFDGSSLSEDGTIRAHHFIKNHKTIIVDLSATSDSKLKCFCTFLILSKFVHYVNTHHDYISKFLVIPNLDLVFNKNYIKHNRNINYDTIDKFFAPLQHNEFGLIALSNNIQYLHNSVFNYFNNFLAAQTRDGKDTSILSNLMNLNELHGTGYFDNLRNETFQINFLHNLQSNEAIMKRADIYQPFPIVIDAQELKTIPSMKYDQIISHMDAQGYDLKSSEQRILENAAKTLYEKDFGDKAYYLPEIKAFLNYINTIQNVGGLYEREIKKHLLKFLWPKIQGVIDKKSDAKEIRDEIFKILETQGYLHENHPRGAGGNEVIRTGYALGVQYSKAEQDTFDTQQDIIQNKQNRLKRALETYFIENIGSAHFEFYYNLKRQKYSKCLHIYKYYLIKFLNNVYKEYNQNFKTIIYKKNIRELITQICQLKGFPFTFEQLEEKLVKAEKIDLNTNSVIFDYSHLYDEILDIYYRLDIFLDSKKEDSSNGK